MSWLARRAFPVLATLLLVAIGLATTTWWAALIGRTDWPLPYDLWGTMMAASRLAHLHLSGLYTQPTGLVSFPGTALILVPAAAVIDAAGLTLQLPGPANPQPAAWLIGGPYQIVISASAIFAADALAERIGVSRGRRALLSAAGAMALWSVSVRWGHPEDAVAVALLLYGVLALVSGRHSRAAWLVGFAVAVQPLVLLAVPVLLAVTPIFGFLVRAAIPSLVTVGAAAAANWSATMHAVTSQPNSPVINHPTLWTSLAAQIGGGTVAAGPFRIVAIVAAVGCGVALRRRWHGALPDASADERGVAPESLVELLWWIAIALALRSVFEPVMVSYYLWPPVAVALVAAAVSWRRLWWTAALAGVVTFVSQGEWRNPWTWWVPLMVGLCLVLVLSRSDRRSVPAPAATPSHVSA